MISRRRVVLALCAGALAAPLASFAQQRKTHRLAILQLGSAESVRERELAFDRGLKELGYVEGKNLVVDRRYADGRGERLPALVAELLKTKPDVVFAPTSPAALAVKAVDGSVPIVIAVVSDPIGLGLAASLARPGGNVTGTSNIQTEIDAKRLQMLKEVLPKITRVGLVHAGDQLAKIQLAAAEQGGRALGIGIVSIEARQPEEYRSAVAAAKRRGIDAILVASNAQNNQNRQLIVELAAQHRMPAIYPDVGWSEQGALMSYGTSSLVLFSRAASYVDRIFKGAKPSDLAIEWPTHFALEINLKTARALGVKFPRSILARVDRAIE